MADSSSSSDDEEKAKLQSAAWPTFSHGTNQKGTKSGIGTEQKKSMRNQEDFEEQGDYRNVDATPEVKTFIAKKLTSWLDSSISVIDGQTSGGSASVAAVDNPDDDFHLFSTSKPGLPVKEESKAVKRKQRPPSSSSDSDSDEQRAKLSSVAVSYDQILQSSSSWPPDSQDPKVTSNLSPTNPHSTLTPAASSQSIPCNSESERHKGLAEGIGSETELKKKRRKKQKKTKTETTSISEAVEQLNESGLPKVIENTQREEENNGKQPKDFENGNEVTSERSERKAKKRKKKKKKIGKSQDTAPQTIHGVNSDASIR